MASSLIAPRQTLPRKNLLINPDFAVNQRNVSEVGANDYIRDCWRAVTHQLQCIAPNIFVPKGDWGGVYQTLMLSPGKYVFSAAVAPAAPDASIAMWADFAGANIGITYTAGGYVSLVIDVPTRGWANAGITIYPQNTQCAISQIKLEQVPPGELAVPTPWEAPDPTEELIKCNWSLSGYPRSGIISLGNLTAGQIVVQDVTFDVPFDRVPVVVTSVYNAQGARQWECYPNHSTQTGFQFVCINHGADNATVSVAWIAQPQ